MRCGQNDVTYDSGVDLLLHITFNDVSVINATAHRCAGGLKTDNRQRQVNTNICYHCMLPVTMKSKSIENNPSTTNRYCMCTYFSEINILEESALNQVR